MKIVHCLDHYMPLHFAGTEIYVHSLAKLQKAAGHDVVVLVPFFNYYASADRQFAAHYIYDTVEVFQYIETSSPENDAIRSGKSLAEGLNAYEALLASLQPDIVHFHELTRSIGLGIPHIKKAKETGAKIILTLHLASNTCNTNNLINHGRLCPGEILTYDCSVCSYKTLYKFPGVIAAPLSLIGMLFEHIGITAILPKTKATTLLAMPSAIKRIRKELDALIDQVDQFVSLTEWYKKILLLNGVPENKLTVIPQALATQTTVHKKNDAPVQLPLRLVFIGRIQSQKGVHLLIEAMNNIPAGKVLLDIYGREEDTIYYKDCIKKSRHNPSIVWKGVIERELVVQQLTAYHVLCLPSTFSEMSPFVIQEAFAAGIPVLASRVYGNAEQITDGVNGWLFDFNNSANLEQKIEALIQDTTLITQAKKNIVSPVRFDAVARAYEKLYSQKSFSETA